MFSLYGASRDNDRCCAWFGECEISQLMPSKEYKSNRYFDWIVESYIGLRHLRYFRIHMAGKKRYLDKYTRKIKIHER